MGEHLKEVLDSDTRRGSHAGSRIARAKKFYFHALSPKARKEKRAKRKAARAARKRK